MTLLSDKIPCRITIFSEFDIIKKFEDKLDMTSEEIEQRNDWNNSLLDEFEGENKRCPVCGKALDLVGNDGHFCKFCGTHLKKEIRTNFMQSLKMLRKGKGLGQTELAKMLDTSTAGVCKLEKGNRTPTEEDLIKLTEIFKCSVNELFGQDAPRKKIKNAKTYQDNLPTIKAKKPIEENDVEGYEFDEEKVFKCPHCGEEIDLTPMEALTLGVTSFTVMQLRTHFNDGNFCKHCGQGIIRPVQIDKDKAFESYKEWFGL
jgi:transcriptional regulator with XRE-family HTH domain